MFLYTGLPVAMAATAMLMDLRTAKVDNAWILLCMAVSLAARALKDGLCGLTDYLCGTLLPLLLLGWLFTLRMLGAGDIKLLMALGGFLGTGRILKCIAASFVIGAGISAAILISNGNICQRFLYFFRYVGSFLETKERKPYYRKGMQPLENFHFTVPIFLSVLLYAGGVY